MEFTSEGPGDCHELLIGDKMKLKTKSSDFIFIAY